MAPKKEPIIHFHFTQKQKTRVVIFPLSNKRVKHCSSHHPYLVRPSVFASSPLSASNHSLHALELTGNYGGADVLHSLARALQSNRTLRRLKLPDAHPEQPLVAQEQALRTLVDAIAVNATLAELHIGAAAAQGLTFELKRHIVETLASAGNSVLGLITSNIELIYSDMGDLQHDVRAGLGLSFFYR